MRSQAVSDHGMWECFPALHLASWLCQFHIRTKPEHTTSFLNFHGKETQVHRSSKSCSHAWTQTPGHALCARAEKFRRSFKRLVGDWLKKTCSVCNVWSACQKPVSPISAYHSSLSELGSTVSQKDLAINLNSSSKLILQTIKKKLKNK